MTPATYPVAAPHRYRVLDAWRGICALLIAFIHAPVAHAWQSSQFFENMQLFVDFFFVLSGFVICHAYGAKLHDSVQALSFMIRRFGRIWPLHAAVLAGFVALELLKLALGQIMTVPLDGQPFTHNHSLPQLASNVFLTQAFNLHGMMSWNWPAWSIGVEFYTYVVFALALVSFGPRTRVFAVLALCGLAGVIAFSPSWLFTTHDFGFFRCLYGFFVGCLVYRYLPSTVSVWSSTAAELAAIAILVAFLAATGKDASSLAAPLVFGLIVTVFAAERGAVSRWLVAAPAQALGLWSYSIYMVHMLTYAVLKIVLTLVDKVTALGLASPVLAPVKLWTFNNGPLDAALVAIHLTVVLLLASQTYPAIEVAARRWFNTLADKVTLRSSRRSVSSPYSLNAPAPRRT